MKNKKLFAVLIVVLLALVGGGVWFYHDQTTVPKGWVDRTLATEMSEPDNKLSNPFFLRFEKNQAYLVARANGSLDSKKSGLNQEIQRAFSKRGKDLPEAGEQVKLGRVKTEKIKNGYKIHTRKVTFIFKKTSRGDYRSQDGTYWQFTPKEQVEKRFVGYNYVQQNLFYFGRGKYRKLQ